MVIMELVFVNNYFNALILLIGVLTLLFVYRLKLKRERAFKFANSEILDDITEGNVVKADYFLFFLRVSAVSLIVLGLSSPLLVEEEPVRDSDFVLALDNSPSMFTGDVEPNRFEAAKSVSINFIQELENNTNAGLVSYSGVVSIEHELNNNHLGLINSIENLGIGDEAGTATGDAIYTGVTLLADSEKNKNLILITDGSHNVGRPLNDSIEHAKQNNVSVNTIGIGEDSDEGFEQDYNVIDGVNATRATFPNLNEGRLFRIANETGGQSIIATTEDGLEEGFEATTTEEVEIDVSNWFILAGLLILVLERVLKTTSFDSIP